MSDWLGEMVRRKRLLWSEGEAARLWASDVGELGRGLSRNGDLGKAGGGSSDDVMRIAIRRRVAEVERRLGGVGSPSYRVAWWVAIEGRTAGEAAALLGDEVRTTTGMDLLYLALPIVADVYGLRGDGGGAPGAGGGAGGGTGDRARPN